MKGSVPIHSGSAALGCLAVLFRIGLVLAWTLGRGAEPTPAGPVLQNPLRTTREYRDFAMGHEGDVARGRMIFQDEARATCVRCHSIDGSSSKVGPDLFAAGDKLPRAELIRAILEPSTEIAVGYGATVVERGDGEEFLGIVKDRTAEALDLMGADGGHVRIAARDIRGERGSQVSLMPEGLQAGLSREEFTDLIEYLVALKQPGSSLTSNRGMPWDIPTLAHPIAVVPVLPDGLRFPHAFVQKPGDVRYGLVWLGEMPGIPGTFLAGHQTGRIWLLEGIGGDPSKTLFADLSRDVFSERGPNGLLGLAFHPEFRRNRRYFVKHQVIEGGRIVTTVVERRASEDFRSDSGQPSRRLWQVVSSTQDHSGGCIAFGPDGFLYIAMGDTGPQQDPQGHGQDLATHLGKMLRVDVNRTDPGLAYAIPADNPFRNRPGVLPEIWAFGFREPWRFSFDSLTGELWVGDVGQDRVEEVGMVRRGENHGWNVYEGFEPFSNRYRKEGAPYQPPVFAYRRKYGNSITGGYVYRGDPISSFHGVYICGDYTSRRIFGVTQKDRTLQVVRQIGTAPQGIASFAEDGRGNLYLVGYEGMLYRLDFSGAVFEGGDGGTHSPMKPTSDTTCRGTPALPLLLGACCGLVALASPRTAAGEVHWVRNAFPLPESIWSVESLDANGDGRPDLVAMGQTRVFGLLAPGWQPQVLGDTQEPKLLYCVALDIDRDGDLDLALGRYRVPWIEWRQARAEGRTVEPPQGPDFSIAWMENPGRIGNPWPLHVLDRELNGTHGLCAGDLNGDGVPDLVADSILGPSFARSLAWYETPPRGEVPSGRHLITRGGADGRPHYLDVADLNGDGRRDVLLGDSGGGTFTWWEQPTRTGEPWTRHLIAREDGATNLRAADINRDGRPDVVASCGHGRGVFWFEAPAWTRRIIDPELRDPHALAVGDFDGDGDPDVAVASFGAKIVRWYENDGVGRFISHDVDTGHDQEAYDLKACDLDADGRLDLILAGRETRNAVWYRNLKPE